MSFKSSDGAAPTRRRIDTVVIGGGHAGVSMSYVLQQAGREHVVLEKGRALEQWRSARWDSFRINSPLGYSRLAGQQDGLADDLLGLPLKRSLELWDQHIAQHAFPIRERCEVVRVERAPGGGFLVQVKAESAPTEYLANNVVAAPGNYQLPRIPESAERLGKEIQQLRVGTYTSPEALAPGAVLVVGGGQTGVQLAEELALAGRRVFLATSRVQGTPRSYRGEDIMFWEERTGLLRTPREDLEDLDELFLRQPIVGGDHSISHYSLARQGVVLLGGLREISSDGSAALFRDDLHDHIAYAQQGYDAIVAVIEAWIEKNGEAARFPPATAEAQWQPYPGLGESATPTRLDLAAEGITTVVWATGWRADFTWLDIDEILQDLGPDGRPERCETPVEGFFWLGFHWLRTRTSGNVAGFHDDASYIAAALG